MANQTSNLSEKIAELIEKFKELKAEVEVLRAENAQLKAQNETVTMQLTSLEDNMELKNITENELLKEIEDILK